MNGTDKIFQPIEPANFVGFSPFTVEKNVKWEASKSNPLEPYVEDQSSTLTTLSNAAFVVGGECMHAGSCTVRV